MTQLPFLLSLVPGGSKSKPGLFHLSRQLGLFSSFLSLGQIMVKFSFKQSKIKTAKGLFLLIT